MYGILPWSDAEPRRDFAELLAILRPAWMADAACRGQGPDLFFAGNNRAARKVCADCPVRQQCLDYAQAEPTLEGVWGGLNRGERQRGVTLTPRKRTARQWLKERGLAS